MGSKPRVAPPRVAIPAEAMLARLEVIGRAWASVRETAFEAALRRAGVERSTAAARLASARARFATEVAAAREHIASLASDPPAFAARIINSEARATLVARCASTCALDAPRAFGGDETVDRDRVFWSDVEVAGDLRISGHVFIAGSLRAGGEVVVDETGALVVARSIRAPTIGGEGWVVGTGGLEARLIWGLYEAGHFDVAGDVRAALAIFADHGHNFDRAHVGTYVDLSGDDGSATASLESAVSPAALSEQGNFGRVDLGRLRELASAGAAILRS